MTGDDNHGPIVHLVAAGEVGGAERMLVRLIAAAPPSGRPPRAHVVALFSSDPALHALFAEAGVRVIPRWPAGVRPRRWPGPPLGAVDVRWLTALLLAVGARAVHLHTCASHVLGSRAARRAGVPVVRTEHSRRAYDNWLCRPLSGWSLRRAARVVAVSHDLAALVRRRFPTLDQRLTVIHNGVPLPPVAPPIDRASPTPLRLALVARLEPRKGIDRALRALARVPGVRLDVVGDGPLRDQLATLTARLKLGERVRFAGYRRDPDAVVAQADLVLCSSRTEGLPMGLLEAMALGRPVLAVPVGGVPEIVTDGDTGWLAAAPTVDALAASLRAVVAAGRPEVARRGAQARRAVERSFSDERMRQAYEALYRALPPPARMTAQWPDVRAA